MKRPTGTYIVATSAASLALLVALTLAGGTALAADAATPAAPASHAGTAQPTGSGPSAAVDQDEQRIKKLHDRLQITQPQEAPWSKVADVMRSNDKTMDALAQTRRETAATRTAAEDLRSYGEITEAHAAGIKAFAAVFDSLYNSMSAAQKKNADEVFRSDDRKTPKKLK